jgi:flagellar assembly factor FliW
MQVETYLFGSVEVNPEKVISFPEGLTGFEGSKRFMLVHEASENSPASYTLQSLDNSNLAFQIVDPSALGFQYELALSDAETALLQTPASEDVAVMLMLYKQEGEGLAGLGANFRAPLIINTRARIGIQKVIGRPRSNIIISDLSSAV